MWIYIYIYIHTYIQAHMCISTYVYIIYLSMCIDPFLFRIVSSFACTCTSPHVCIYIYMYICPQMDLLAYDVITCFSIHTVCPRR